MRRWPFALFVVVVLVGACAADDDRAPYTAEVVVDGLVGPTQLTIAPDGGWYVAQLAGGENDGTGQVLRIDPADPSAPPVVVVDGLRKPTGVAVFAGELWIMEERRLTRGSLDGGPRSVVADAMAFNGRSEGTLTIDGDRLLFDTSGSSRVPTGPGGSPADTSGALWAVDAEGRIENVAWGFKHAYAHVRGPDGTLWTTEISDGRFDGESAADEIVAVVEGSGHGWPVCVGDNRAVVESGLETPCEGVPGSQMTFAPGATPTGIAVAPWDPGRLVVALWVEQRLVEVAADPAEAMTGSVRLDLPLDRPQHLVADGDRLLVTDHAAGTIVAVARN